MKSSPRNWLEAAAYDPSYRRADTLSYWQWSNASLGEQWDQAAECVNKGWPANSELRQLNTRWHGFIAAQDGKFWIYRGFPAGRDRKGRDGRYFFILVRLQSKQDLLNPKVAGLFRYFDTERGLPLNTDPLDEGWLDAEPDEILRAISKKLDGERSLSHWGITDGGHITVFSEISPLLQTSSAVKPKQSTAGRIASIAGTPPVLKQLPYLSEFSRGLRGRVKVIKRFVGVCTGIALVLLLVLLGIEGWRKMHLPKEPEVTGTEKDKPKEPKVTDSEKDKPKEPKVTDPEKDKPKRDPQESRQDAPEGPPKEGATPRLTPKTLPTQSEGQSKPSKTPETQPES